MNPNDKKYQEEVDALLAMDEDEFNASAGDEVEATGDELELVQTRETLIQSDDEIEKKKREDELLNSIDNEEDDEDEESEEDNEDSGDDDTDDDDSDDDNEDTDDSEDDEDDLIDFSTLKGKKASLKWNKVTTTVDADKLVELAQKGINYDMKMSKLKDATEIQELMSNTGVSVDEINSFIEFKKDGGNLKDFLAANNIELEKFREDVYSFEQTDLDSAREARVPRRTGNVIVDDLIPSVPRTVDIKMGELFEDIPGLKQFTDSVIGSSDVKTFNALVGFTADGTFDRVKDRMVSQYIGMSDVDKYKFVNDPMSFAKVFNTIVGVGQSDTTQTDPEASPDNTNQDSRVSSDSLKKKNSFGKKKSRKGGLSKPKTKQEENEAMLAKYLSMNDEEVDRDLLTY